MSLWLIIICILLTNSNGETLLNPTESEYHCGINEDCTIQCNVSQVCNNIKFYVYNHKVSFECSGDSSCVETKLIASNVTELTIIVTGFQALLSAEVIVDSSNTKVNTVCNGLRTCYHARFHYNSKETVDHVCDGDRGCWYASIHAVSLFILCVIFIIVPTSITLIQLYHATSKHWNRNDEIRAWMTQYIYILYMISIVCGSAFTGIQLCRSNMFDLPVFDMPLTRKDALKFETKKKIYITIIF
eukprot:365055_1